MVKEAQAKYLAIDKKEQIALEKDSCPDGYKLTEVGVIPEDWWISKFGKFAYIRNHKVNPKNSGGSEFCIELEHISQRTGQLIGSTETNSKSSIKVVFEKGDVLFGKLRAYLRKYWLSDKQGVASTEIWPFVAIEGNTIPEYLSQIVRMDSFIDAASNAYGTHMPRTDWNIIKELPIAMPSVVEQTAIAKALSDVDALISSLEKLIAKKQAIKTATMQQLLTGKKRLPGFGEGKGYKQTELGEIPEDWEVLPLKKCLKENPKYGINAPAVRLQGNLPVYIRITDISEDGYFRPLEKVGVNSPFSALYIMERGDLVVARTGASVGKSYLYRESDGDLIYAGFLIKLSPKKKVLLPLFLFQYLKTETYWSWVNVMSMRSGQPGINGNEYGQLLVPVPLLKEQIAITTVLSEMDLDIVSLKNRLAKTQQIKQGMMQELLTGKTRLIQTGSEVSA